MAGSLKARFEKARARYLAADEALHAFDRAMTLRYSGAYKNDWLTRGERTKREALHDRHGRASDAVFALLESSPRDWRSRVPANWVAGELTYEDAFRPLSEPLSVTVPLSYGASEQDRMKNNARRGSTPKYYVVEQAQARRPEGPTLYYQVGHFATKPAAERFRQDVPGRARIVHTYPSSHDYPVLDVGRLTSNARGAPLDEHAAIELKIYIDNTAELMGPRSQGESIRQNLLRKIKSGKFDLGKSVKLWEYLAEAGAKMYIKEFGSNEPGEWAKVFSVATRREVAREMAEEFYTEAKLGNYTMRANASRRPNAFEDQEEIHPEVAGFRFYDDDKTGMVVMVDDEGREVYIVNPLEVPMKYGHGSGRQVPIILWFDQHAPTRLLIWARSLEDALEEAGATLAEHFPGLIMAPDDPELKDLFDEAREELGEDADDDEAWEQATADLTYTESGYITSYEWGIDSELREGNDWREATEAATAISKFLYEDEYGEED
jgi:hypothetical protein